MYKYQYEKDMLIEHMESRMKLVHQENNIITEWHTEEKKNHVSDSLNLIQSLPLPHLFSILIV